MTSKFDVTVAIPSIPPRAQLLRRAVESVLAQDGSYVAGLSIAVDHRHEGAGPTRQRALDGVTTPWVAFLDDDDEFMSDHIESLMHHAYETDADYVFSWFEVIAGGGRRLGDRDPVFPTTHFTEPWDNNNPRQTTITVLVKTELAKAVGFVPAPDGKTIDGQRFGEDWQFTLGCLAAGARINHLVKRTWFWHHDSGNTSGRPDRW